MSIVDILQKGKLPGRIAVKQLKTWQLEERQWPLGSHIITRDGGDAYVLEGLNPSEVRVSKSRDNLRDHRLEMDANP